MLLLYYPGVLDFVLVALLAFALPLAAFILWENKDKGWVQLLVCIALIALVVYH